jgi:capsular polysaccharide biosynthesis protein
LSLPRLPKEADLKNLLWRRRRAERRTPPWRVLRTFTLREIDVPRLAFADLLHSGRPGHAEVFPRVLVERKGRWKVEAPAECEQQGKLLRNCFGTTSYPAAAMTLTRLNDVFLSTSRGVCATADGILLDESAYVARQIDPSLAHVPFIALRDNRFTPDRCPELAGPVLHCFHGAAGAYGHFLFDVLPIIALCREEIIAGRLKVLVPPFPPWGHRALDAFGIEPKHIVTAQDDTLRCSNMLIANTLMTLNTFLPNPDLCKIPAKAMGIDITAPWTCPNASSRIYLSRENQTNHFPRGVENEDEVRIALRAMGFAILEPANMSFRDQVAAINNASVIVGVHGSGFGNLIFARPGTVVIDLMPQDWVGFFGAIGGPERWVFNVTTAFDLDYTVILCRSHIFQHLPESDTSGSQKRGIAATVDVDLLRHTISETAR